MDKELVEKVAQYLYYRGKTTGTCNLDYIPKWQEVPDIFKESLRKEAQNNLIPIIAEEIKRGLKERCKPVIAEPSKVLLSMVENARKPNALIITIEDLHNFFEGYGVKKAG